MLEFITNCAMDLSQVQLSGACGKYFNLMYLADDCVVVQSFEANDGYQFTNINDLTYKDIKKIYKDLKVDFD